MVNIDAFYKFVPFLKAIVHKFYLTEIFSAIVATWTFLFLYNKVGLLFAKLMELLDTQKNIFPTIKVKKLEIVSNNQLLSLSRLVLQIVKAGSLIVLIMLYFLVVFSIFPGTRGITANYVGYFFSLIKQLFLSALSFIPNGLTIIGIGVLTFYLLKFLKFITFAVATKKIRFSGVYPEWAHPTYKIAQFIIIIIALIMSAPYFPGFHSPAFKGISLFVGVLLSLGSTSAVANIIAGVLLVYMRAFNVGDRIKTSDVIGDVVEKSLLVTKIRTIKNIEVTIPNSAVLGTPTYNYTINASDSGIILHTSVTIGYDVSWKKVHELLLNAAQHTKGLMKDPEPFVIQKSLDDYHVRYEINVYTNKPKEMESIYSKLHQNIQDEFNKANVEIVSPAYSAIRDGNRMAIPANYLTKSNISRGFQVEVKK